MDINLTNVSAEDLAKLKQQVAEEETRRLDENAQDAFERLLERNFSFDDFRKLRAKIDSHLATEKEVQRNANMQSAFDGAMAMFSRQP
ncbi:hypothetical protein H6F88_02000 [Oculatella sp. FACHB-28]|uniref:hypothetical protein n=1 Tax=Oculatella sp. FACHB-28 TaxID=2692845 RepID=UPI00168670C8|nr:hypothetical protein [Oculatella sp. FACHB-28]MBD2054807.1 hypothetical protein [Oculatella sp. FACHB-28]